MKIFLSHTSRDKPLVREFRTGLPAFLRSKTWLDEDNLLWGDALAGTLKTTIQTKVDFLVIFLTRQALDSAWVRQELEWATAREGELKRTFVLPILIEDVPNDDLPDYFKHRRYLKLSDFEHESVIALANDATMELFQLIVEGQEKADERSGVALDDFFSIGVDPLKMYGFGAKNSPLQAADQPTKFESKCVRALWADPKGNHISARCDNDGYTIGFDNGLATDWPSDVTIRPAGDQPLSTGTHRELAIGLRCPAGEAATTVAVAFRVIDRLGTQWHCARGDQFYTVILKPGQPAEAVLKIRDASTWRLFDADGNRLYQAADPDFSMIAAIIVEVGGSLGASRRPGGGSGTVLVTSIALGGKA